jgi:hypothetical protein
MCLRLTVFCSLIRSKAAFFVLLHKLREAMAAEGRSPCTPCKLSRPTHISCIVHSSSWIGCCEEQSKGNLVSRYKIMVDDNFHYMDDEDRYELGIFSTIEEAIAACKRIVDADLTELAVATQ